MCGIIGYVGDKEIVPVLINGLKKLEYRGYDSAGICVLDKGVLKTIKEKGRISELESKPELGSLKGNLGIAHTRWATHGIPDEKNSHPHNDCKNQISLVHNGIIENFQALKKLLEKENHKFLSDTDSEVIAHLIEKFYNGNLEEAVIKALKLLEGAFGLAIIDNKENRIIGARRGSPLILGVGEGEMFLASDVPAILEHTKKVIYLNDNEIAIISKDNYEIKHLNGDSVNATIHEINWSVKEIEKGNFKHFMLKEIFEQPESIKNVLRGRIKDGKIKLTLNINPYEINRIVLTACGTSWHSALIGKYLIEQFTRIPVEVDYASEFQYRDPILRKEDLVIAISQSGETADTLSAIKEAKSKNAQTLGIVNVVGSTITREVGSGIYLHAGPETGVASTKAFTSQVVALLLLALYIKQEKGLLIEKNILEELEKIPEKIEKTLESSNYIKSIAYKFQNSKNFLYFGRGINYPTALEGALKLKEISYIHAEGYPAAEMKHGPIALVDENMPIIFLATKSALSQKILGNIEEVKARNGIIISIVNNRESEYSHYSDYVIEVPETLEELSPIINVIPLQLLAYHIANIRGLDVDKPRNLAKSVTVE
jgi:glutamine---fructose-6-phosphate transaminase (isomerizing)